MKNYMLEPNDDNIKNTFCNDTLERNKYLFKLINILDSTNGNLSIALDGQWGSGKTFFVKQVRKILNVRSDHSSDNDIYTMIPDKQKSCTDKYVTLYYDAWLHDEDPDPLLSIIFSVMQEEQISATLKNNQSWDKVVQTIGDIIDLAGGTVGKVLVNIFNNIKGKSFTEVLENKKKLDEAINVFFNDVINNGQRKLVVFIDELDRCNPNYAIRLLERVKHYCTKAGIVFVFAVDIEKLECTVQQHYGSNFNGNRYLDKFFDMRIGLPSIELANYFKYKVGNNNGKYANSLMRAIIVGVSEKLNFSMREFDRYLMTLDMASYGCLNKITKNNNPWVNTGRMSLISYVFIPIMVALKMTDTQKYNEFINGKGYTIIKEIVEKNDISFGYMFKKSVDSQGTSEKDILKNVYDSIFADGKPLKIFSTLDTNPDFSKDSKVLIQEVMSLLSDFNDLNYGDDVEE